MFWIKNWFVNCYWNFYKIIYLIKIVYGVIKNDSIVRVFFIVIRDVGNVVSFDEMICYKIIFIFGDGKVIVNYNVGI